MKIQTTSAFHRRRFELVKKAVSVPTLARDLLAEKGQELKKSGQRWRGPCPVCGHGQSSGAFSCREDLWHCFSCGEGGDVVKLADLAVPFDSPSMACAWVAHRYGVPLPDRPEAWFKKQSRQEKTREALREQKEMVKRRRLFKAIMVPLLRGVGADEDEVRAAWEDFSRVPMPLRMRDE